MQAAAAAVERKPRLRIVVIDDEPDAVLMLLALLRVEGHDAIGFSSAREAMKGIEEFDPDVIISDLSMPVKSGWDIAREVRKNASGDRPLLIAISGVYTRSADKILTEIAGYHYYLTKPCDPKVLLELVDKAAE
jgi:DNA-binding response OmpR family regulator